MSKKLILTFVIFTTVIRLFPQTITHPNYGLKSHETLDIESVVPATHSTTLNMVIENRSLDGTFCADKNIFILLPGGKRLKINKAEGIPRCPDTYVFKNFGEKLFFSLIFPALPEGTEWFDLVEECNEACFSFYGIILDDKLNQKIDHAYALSGSGEYEEAGREFESLLLDLYGRKCSYEGAVYWNLVHLARKVGDESKAGEWSEKLNNSDITLKKKYAEVLKNY